MKNRYSIILATTMLTGCFNTSVSTNTHYIQNNKYSVVSEYIATVEKTTGCDFYIPLPASPPPDIPVDKIRKSTGDTDKQTLNILTVYIKDLREHMVNRKKEEAVHYEAYLKTCKLAVK